MALGVPIVVSRTKIDNFYFKEGIVEFSEPENENALANAIKMLLSNPQKRDLQAQRANKFVSRYNWEDKKSVYFNLVEAIITQ